jgi:DNA-binding MarR family transcriptional regulator
MRAAWAIGLTAILLAPLANADAGGLALNFASPAQAGPHLSASGAHWVWLLFDNTPARISLSIPEASYSNHTYLYAGPRLIDDNGFPLYADEISNTTTHYPGRSLTLDFTGRPHASLYLAADSIRINLDNTTTAVNVLAAHADTASALQDAEIYGSSHRVGVRRTTQPEVAITAVHQHGEAPLGFALAVSGLRVAEWHNATVTCPVQPCPDGAGATDSSVRAPTRDGLLVVRRYFSELDTHDGTAIGHGAAARAATGGASLDLALDGWFRLPFAQRERACACVDPHGQTFQADGNLRLDNLTATGDRLRADLSGSAAWARLDETAVNPSHLFGNLAATAAASTAAVVLIAWAAWALFSRELTPEDALAHPKRLRLLEAIKATPGAVAVQLARTTGFSRGSVRNHLEILERLGLVVSNRHARVNHYFENHGRYTNTWRIVAANRDPSLGFLLRLLRDHPNAGTPEILKHASEARLTRAAVLRRLSRLEALGLVQSEAGSGTRRYRINPFLESRGPNGEDLFGPRP